MFAEGEQEKKLLKSKCKCMCLCVYKTAKLCHKKFDREKKISGHMKMNVVYVYRIELREKFITINLYSPSDNFSPESGGKAKPNSAIEAINTHGTIKLKK